MTGELSIVRDGPVVRLTLARPDKRNALSRSLVTALRDAFTSIHEGEGVRVVVLAGDGPAFCAGADIGEFVDAAQDGQAVADARGIADLLAAMSSCPAPIIAPVHGAVYGGGVGLVCAADIAIAAEGTRFALSEARLGLVPAVIAPWVFAALGRRQARAVMLQAGPFDTDRALRCGLVHQCVPEHELESVVEETIGHLLQAAPGALAAIKRLPSMIDGFDPAQHRAATTALLAERLASDEGQEGLRAFLEKRPAGWTQAEAPR